MHIVVACGGTGGHIFPGLAAAEALRARGHDVHVWLAGRTVEKQSAGSWTGPVATLPWTSPGAGSPAAAIRSAAGLLAAWRACRARLRAGRPAALLAMGSYASVPPVLAARSLRIPVVLHESNVIPGRAVACLARLATVVATGFPETGSFLRARRVVCSGFPLRDLRPAQDAPVRAGAPAVLVMGGSLGAHRLNELAAEALCALRAEGRGIRVIHLAGVRDEAAVRARYEGAGVPAVVHGFLHDMPSAYGAASLAVSRAGAASCAELALFGLPAVLVPYPFAARNHQLANARAVERDGAAVAAEESSLTADLLAGILRGLLADPARAAAMAAAAHARSRPGATAELAQLVESVAEEGSGRLA